MSIRVDERELPALSFFKTLWPDSPEVGRLGVGPVNWQTWFDLTPKGIAAAVAHAAAKGTDVYFAVCAHDRSEGRASGETATFSPALWVDLDFEKQPGDGYPTETQARETLRTLPARPSIVIGSGRGFHAYWALTKFLPATEAAKLCRRFQELVRRALPNGCRLDSTADAARVLRVPGTINSKCGRVVTIEKLDGPRYHPDELAGVLDELGITVAAESPPGDSQERGGTSLMIAVDDPRVDAAIEKALPEAGHTGHKALFRFVQHLKALPELSPLPARALLPLSARWHSKARPLLDKATDSREVERNFVDAWNRVRFPAGAWDRAAKQAKQSPDPRVEILFARHGFCSPLLYDTLALCFELGKDGRNFPLSSQTSAHGLAGFLGCGQQSAYRQLAKLLRCGLLEQTKQGTRGTKHAKLRASEYQLTRAALAPDSPQGPRWCHS